MSRAGGSQPVFLAEVTRLQQALPDLPVSWHWPYPKFLKLSPFFRIEQLQDGYFCFFS